MQTWHIHIEGQVQGVGFRPFVYVLANEFKLNGWVNNTVDGVHIEINATEQKAMAFYETIINQAPELSQITQHKITINKQKFFDNFQIIHSDQSGKANLLLTPDFGLCKDCQTDIHSESNQRHQYAFTTCTNCGPRYSIVEKLPYDRERTTMQSFPMCPRCRTEYNLPTDRRYYSQTNSCGNCGVQLAIFDKQQHYISLPQKEMLNAICRYWQTGKIVAIKGIGGYLLTCDARNEQAIQLLRERKYRPSKPLALMYPDLEQVKNDLIVNASEAKSLASIISPIVLLDTKAETPSRLATSLAPNLNQVGVMLPYTPLFDLLLKKFQRPIAATSGNISQSPIVYKDEKAAVELMQIADFVVTNNRPIVVPQDDSVLKFSTFTQQKILLRRSRGLAPTYINADLKLPSQTILATGAMLKSTFSLLHQNNTYISQYLGDLGHFDTEQSYRHTVRHFFQLFETQPEIILTDKHPEYAATLFGEQLSKELTIPIHRIQHHIAHFGAVLGENNLVDVNKPILGVIWDGTGLGDDGQIWGGEFFTYDNHNFQRRYYFDYFDFILGDKMPKEPRISALSACWGIGGIADFLKEKFTKTEWSIYTKLLAKKNPLKTSSVGRLFDAVASLLGILDKQTYEGEAAMQLEQLATSYFKKNGLHFSSDYFDNQLLKGAVPTKMLLVGVVNDLKKGVAKDYIAAKFQFSLVQLVSTVANNLKIQQIAFSGGVFQNGLLVDLLQHYLAKEFTLYFHQQLSPNDENISFGQLVCHQIERLKEKAKDTKSSAFLEV
ncbi:MAG: carbamoyltransferase HypF [Bacteroidota bacterium]